MTGFHFGSSIDLISDTVNRFIHLSYSKHGQLDTTVVCRLSRVGGTRAQYHRSNSQKISKERRCL